MITKFSEDFKEKVITKYLDKKDYLKGKNYLSSYICDFYCRRSANNPKILEVNASVESERSYWYYDCDLLIDNNRLIEYECDCPQYSETGSCKHLAALLYFYFDDIFKFEPTNEYKEGLTLKILNKFNKKETKKMVSEEVMIKYELNNIDRLDILNLTLKVGTTKLYSCKNNKLKQFKGYKE